MADSKAWYEIFKTYNLYEYNFDEKPFEITAQMIKEATKNFKKTNQREVRILCKQDSKENRPEIFKKLGLFILPIKNGKYKIIKGEGYLDIPKFDSKEVRYISKLDFCLDTAKVGNSEMQHLDYAYASSIIRDFMQDDSLVLTIRGRKYTPKFSFYVNNFFIEVESVQTEVDAGYEGKDKIVLIEAKNSKTKNIIIRQIFYPFKQWKQYTKKPIFTIFFEKQGKYYNLWQFKFNNENDYNSVEFVKYKKYEIVCNEK